MGETYGEYTWPIAPYLMDSFPVVCMYNVHVCTYMYVCMYVCIMYPSSMGPVNGRCIHGYSTVHTSIHFFIVLICCQLYHPPGSLPVCLKEDMVIRELFWCVCSTGGVFGVVTGKVDNIGRKLRLSEPLVEHFKEVAG